MSDELLFVIRAALLWLGAGLATKLERRIRNRKSKIQNQRQKQSKIEDQKTKILIFDFKILDLRLGFNFRFLIAFPEENMTCNDIRIALSAAKARSGVPVEISDSDGRTVRVMHLDSGEFELYTRGQSRYHSFSEAADLLCWLQGSLRVRELDAVRYAIGAA